MKMFKSAKMLTGLGLAASLFWGCQDLLSQKDDASAAPEIATDATALRLSVKDDSVCRGQWSAILAARTSGQPDSVAEAAFLSGCVSEIKPGKDKLLPVIPPRLEPDSLSRCRWIVAQIDGGRDSLTVSYKRYCPEDCRKLEEKDSVRHGHLCHEHGVKPPKPPHDTTVHPPKDTLPKPPRDTTVYPPKDTLPKPPHDSTVHPPKDTLPKPPHDSTVHPPKDTLPKPPRDTTVHPPKDTLPKLDRCEELLKKLNSVTLDSGEYLHLKEVYVKECLVPKDTVAHPPKDSLPKPPLAVFKCEEANAKLLTLDPASAEYIHLQATLKEKCTEIGPAVE